MVTKDEIISLLNRNEIDKVVGFGEEAIGHLIEALNDENLFVRWHSAIALGELKNPNPQIFEALLLGLNKNYRDHDGRACIYSILKIIGSDEVDKIIFSTESLLKSRLIDVINRIADELINKLQFNSYNRGVCINGLAEIGRWDVTTIRKLIKELKTNADLNTKCGCAVALGKKGGQFATEELLEGLRDKDPLVRKACIEGIAEMGKTEDGIFSLLEKEATSRMNWIINRKVREGCRDALEIIKKSGVREAIHYDDTEYHIMRLREGLKIDDFNWAKNYIDFLEVPTQYFTELYEKTYHKRLRSLGYEDEKLGEFAKEVQDHYGLGVYSFMSYCKLLRAGLTHEEIMSVWDKLQDQKLNLIIASIIEAESFSGLDKTNITERICKLHDKLRYNDNYGKNKKTERLAWAKQLFLNSGKFNPEETERLIERMERKGKTPDEIIRAAEIASKAHYDSGAADYAKNLRKSYLGKKKSFFTFTSDWDGKEKIDWDSVGIGIGTAATIFCLIMAGLDLYAKREKGNGIEEKQEVQVEQDSEAEQGRAREEHIEIVSPSGIVLKAKLVDPGYAQDKDNAAELKAELKKILKLLDDMDKQDISMPADLKKRLDDLESVVVSGEYAGKSTLDSAKNFVNELEHRIKVEMEIKEEIQKNKEMEMRKEEEQRRIQEEQKRLKKAPQKEDKPKKGEFNIDDLFNEVNGPSGLNHEQVLKSKELARRMERTNPNTKNPLMPDRRMRRHC